MKNEKQDFQHNRFPSLGYLDRDACLLNPRLFFLCMRSRVSVFGGQAQECRH
jgi:hypothetical protein